MVCKEQGISSYVLVNTTVLTKMLLELIVDWAFDYNYHELCISPFLDVAGYIQHESFTL